MKHEIGTFGAGAGFKGICTCGWMGEVRPTSDEALGDAKVHKARFPLSSEDGQRLLLLRERVRTCQGSPTWDDVAFAILLFDRLRRPEDAD